MARRSEPPLPEELGVLIKETQTVLHQRMDEALRPLGLTVPQYVCLQNLHDSPGITSSELARRTFVTRQAMNVLLQGLVQRGLVERSDDPGPRRELAATPTDSASALLRRAHDHVGSIVQRMTADLSHHELERLRELLATCRDSLLDQDHR
ncbi:MAG: MarR family transcriptional regulator [Microbacterium sp.]